ncbi:MAG: DUF1015 domain-containing protein [Deltaproteobacteria bacterium]|nr:DUF1015 domain-containing protein [Deltaproteobacteria bacterium]MBN2687783.1 DUF1015 domain-containing protein [Deltaproteobacteria bacterium]
MCTVIPFRAVRPVEKFAKDVASYPYDIIDSQEARALAADNPWSFLHVVKSEIDLPEDTDLYDDSVYEKAKQNYRRLLREGILVQDDKPCFYIYCQRMGGHEQFGIVGCAAINDYETGCIKKHELTRADKEIDRTKHIDRVNAQTGPVFLTYRKRQSIDDIVASVVAGPPEYDFTADDGISHAVWVIADADMIGSIRNEFQKVETIYIADGHHRAASAAEVAKKRRLTNPADETAEYNYVLSVIFPHDHLNVLDYNRVVRDLNGLRVEEFLGRLGEDFSIVEDFSGKSPGKAHGFGMYLDGRWYGLTAKDHVVSGHDVIDALDVSILQRRILTPLLGISDPRTDNRIIFVGGIRGMTELERLVDSRAWAVAFSLYPTTVEELMNVADRSMMMPPKSTWFEPKLRSGLFSHLLE